MAEENRKVSTSRRKFLASVGTTALTIPGIVGASNNLDSTTSSRPVVILKGTIDDPVSVEEISEAQRKVEEMYVQKYGTLLGSRLLLGESSRC
ncbi:hypothetical protein [Haloarchaeobius sp. DYHT-AS-18]|uniref:hypothetical protein n=1 Tax=Haloarchaeobius sp. DYHT-AS-18 TaxID=3446117 RepID=UPI003EC14ECA